MIMDKISIKQLMDAAPYPEAGLRLYELAQPLIVSDMPVRMDLNGVESLPTLFMNMSFGKLITEFGKPKVMAALKFYAISKVQLERIKRYFQQFDPSFSNPVK